MKISQVIVKTISVVLTTATISDSLSESLDLGPIALAHKYQNLLIVISFINLALPLGLEPRILH